MNYLLIIVVKRANLKTPVSTLCLLLRWSSLWRRQSLHIYWLNLVMKMEASLRYQDDVDFYKLIGIANEVDALNAPIDTPSHVREDGQLPKYVAKEVIDIIRKFRNLIHPAAALRQSFDPR